MRECALPESHEEATNMHMPKRNSSFEFGNCENVEMVASASETGIKAHRRDLIENASEGQELDDAFEIKIAHFTNTRLEPVLDYGTKLATCSESSRCTSPPTSATFEEFFDAPDAPLDDCTNEPEASSTSCITKTLDKSTQKSMLRLQEEIARRMRAEETLALLQQRWNAMAKKCLSMGISLTSGEDTLGESGRQSVQDLYVQFPEKLVVTRLVGGAVASAATRAMKDEELEGMVARKN